MCDLSHLSVVRLIFSISFPCHTVPQFGALWFCKIASLEARIGGNRRRIPAAAKFSVHLGVHETGLGPFKSLRLAQRMDPLITLASESLAIVAVFQGMGSPGE